EPTAEIDAPTFTPQPNTPTVQLSRRDAPIEVEQLTLESAPETFVPQFATDTSGTTFPTASTTSEPVPTPNAVSAQRASAPSDVVQRAAEPYTDILLPDSQTTASVPTKRIQHAAEPQTLTSPTTSNTNTSPTTSLPETNQPASDVEDAASVSFAPSEIAQITSQPDATVQRTPAPIEPPTAQSEVASIVPAASDSAVSEAIDRAMPPIAATASSTVQPQPSSVVQRTSVPPSEAQATPPEAVSATHEVPAQPQRQASPTLSSEAALPSPSPLETSVSESPAIAVQRSAEIDSPIEQSTVVNEPLGADTIARAIEPTIQSAPTTAPVPSSQIDVAEPTTSGDTASPTTSQTLDVQASPSVAPTDRVQRSIEPESAPLSEIETSTEAQASDVGVAQTTPAQTVTNSEISAPSVITSSEAPSGPVKAKRVQRKAAAKEAAPTTDIETSQPGEPNISRTPELEIPEVESVETVQADALDVAAEPAAMTTTSSDSVVQRSADRQISAVPDTVSSTNSSAMQHAETTALDPASTTAQPNQPTTTPTDTPLVISSPLTPQSLSDIVQRVAEWMSYENVESPENSEAAPADYGPDVFDALVSAGMVNSTSEPRRNNQTPNISRAVDPHSSDNHAQPEGIVPEAGSVEAGLLQLLGMPATTPVVGLRRPEDTARNEQPSDQPVAPSYMPNIPAPNTVQREMTDGVSTPPVATSNPAPSGNEETIVADIEALARQVYDLLRQRLRNEQERRNRF
ncbi:MAG: hypothetical protein H7175_02485, partial [Burkholderiales bacterium]|nr:hypothetical protein [Anaerolineae bacterium]